MKIFQRNVSLGCLGDLNHFRVKSWQIPVGQGQITVLSLQPLRLCTLLYCLSSPPCLAQPSPQIYSFTHGNVQDRWPQDPALRDTETPGWGHTDRGAHVYMPRGFVGPTLADSAFPPEFWHWENHPRARLKWICSNSPISAGYQWQFCWHKLAQWSRGLVALYIPRQIPIQWQPCPLSGGTFWKRIPLPSGFL